MPHCDICKEGLNYQPIFARGDLGACRACLTAEELRTLLFRRDPYFGKEGWRDWIDGWTWEDFKNGLENEEGEDMQEVRLKVRNLIVGKIRIR